MTLIIRAEKHVLIHLPGDEKTGRKAKHHLLVFKIPDGYGVWPASIRCSLLSWTPTHGSIKHWRFVWSPELKEEDQHLLGEREVGLLVPRFFWDIIYRWLPEGIKMRAFKVKALKTLPVG